jgi:hypothetical protein
MTRLLTDGAADARRTYVFAHGAGAGMSSGFMTEVARGIAAAGIRVVRFEFPYMSAGRRRPDPANVLLDCWRGVVAEVGAPGRLVIGGKSMGGRIASMVADELDVAGLLVFGYPFHPVGTPEKLRTEHLASLKTPALIVQGTKDKFGTRGEVESYALSKAIRVEWIEGGDHSLGKDLTKPVEVGVRFLTETPVRTGGA